MYLDRLVQLAAHAFCSRHSSDGITSSAARAARWTPRRPWRVRTRLQFRSCSASFPRTLRQACATVQFRLSTTLEGCQPCIVQTAQPCSCRHVVLDGHACHAVPSGSPVNGGGRGRGAADQLQRHSTAPGRSGTGHARHGGGTAAADAASAKRARRRHHSDHNSAEEHARLGLDVLAGEPPCSGACKSCLNTAPCAAVISPVPGR